MNRLRILLLVVLAVSSCNRRHFADQNIAAQFLAANRKALEDAGEEWAATEGKNAEACFCHFKEDSYRWRQAYIRRSETGYTLSLNGESRVNSLDEAARVVNVRLADLEQWIELTRKLKIYCVSDGPEHSVKLLLKGSDWSPYGFLYVPKGQVHSETRLRSHSAKGRLGDMAIEHVAGRWFYFEDKR